MPDAAWKAYERRIADVLGGERVGPAGVESADIRHDWLAPECKFRSFLPRWLFDTIAQAVTNAEPGKLPLAILHEKGARWPDDLVIMRLGDFVEWFNPKGGKQDE